MKLFFNCLIRISELKLPIKIKCSKVSTILNTCCSVKVFKRLNCVYIWDVGGEQFIKSVWEEY